VTTDEEPAGAGAIGQRTSNSRAPLARDARSPLGDSSSAAVSFSEMEWWTARPAPAGMVCGRFRSPTTDQTRRQGSGRTAGPARVRRRAERQLLAWTPRPRPRAALEDAGACARGGRQQPGAQAVVRRDRNSVGLWEAARARADLEPKLGVLERGPLHICSPEERWPRNDAAAALESREHTQDKALERFPKKSRPLLVLLYSDRFRSSDQVLSLITTGGDACAQARV
jgi:hypothetical protein